MIKNTPFKIAGDGLAIDGKWFANSRQDVQDWLAGKDDDWKALESTFIEETATYDNWLLVQSYDQNLLDYQAAVDAYDNWDGEGEQPTLPENVTKPQGYYTQEEVNTSLTTHTEWQAEEVAFESIDGEVFSKLEPEILLRPADIASPTVTALPEPMPNVPEDEFSAEELIQQEQEAINSEALAYLMSTDWYIIRGRETGAVIPADVLTKRQEARDSIV